MLSVIDFIRLTGDSDLVAPVRPVSMSQQEKPAFKLVPEIALLEPLQSILESALLTH